MMTQKNKQPRILSIITQLSHPRNFLHLPLPQPLDAPRSKHSVSLVQAPNTQFKTNLEIKRYYEHKNPKYPAADAWLGTFHS